MEFNFNIPLGTPEEIIFFISNIVVMLCVFSIFVAIIIDFTEFQKSKRTKKEKKSIVETGSMMIFFLFFYILIRFSLGQIDTLSLTLKYIFMLTGSLIVILGCTVNIIGRMHLGKNWSNQIKIYNDHTLISTSVYGIVRHPLYASIMWMFLGASFIFLNYFAFLASVLIFIPFMYYRAKQEEKLLINEFAEYKNYQLKVGMFFPKRFKKYEKI